METLNHYVKMYQKQLEEGSIQKAYRGIMTAISLIKSQLAKRHPDFNVSALYFGYMDMTYFAEELIDRPDFDHPEAMTNQIENKVMEFIKDIAFILDASGKSPDTGTE